MRILDGRVFLVLIANVTHDLFQQVFDGHQTGHPAIFVDDDAHMLLLALHLAQQFVAPLGLRNKNRRPLNAGHRARASLFVADLQEVVRKRKTSNTVQRTCVDRHSREVVFEQQFQKLFQRRGLRHGEHLRPRRHHITHQFVSEFNRGAHQVAVILFQNPLLFAGLQQGLHVHGSLLLRAGRLVCQRRHGIEEADKDGNRRHKPQQQADGPHQPRRPMSSRVVEEQGRKNLVAENHHQHHGKNCLRDLGIRGPRQVRSAIEEYCSQCQRDGAQRQLLQHCRGQRRMLAAQSELWFYLDLPRVQILLDLARQYLAEF